MADNVRVKIEERLRAAFSEVMQKAGVLIDEALDEHFADMKAIFLRDRALAVSLALAVDMNEAGQIEVAITCGYVKEKVKQKTTARVTPGQTEIPPEAYRTVDPVQPTTEEQERRPIFDESRMIGSGTPQLAAGEPLHMGAGEDEDPADNIDYHASSERANPFKTETWNTFGTRDRLNLVKGFNAEQLRDVIALPQCQKSVVQAAQRRLKKLEKVAPKKDCDNCGQVDSDGCPVAHNCNPQTYPEWTPKAAVA
jgi:hypothetical protein